MPNHRLELTVTVSAGAEQGKTSLALKIADLLRKAGIGREVSLVLQEDEDDRALRRKLEKAQYALDGASISVRTATTKAQNRDRLGAAVWTPPNPDAKPTFRTINPATPDSVREHIRQAIWHLHAAEHQIGHADSAMRGDIAVRRGSITELFERHGGEVGECPWAKGDGPGGKANPGIV